MKFTITGAYRETGEDLHLTLDAHDRAAVERWAMQNGIIWSDIVPQPALAAPAQAYPPQPRLAPPGQYAPPLPPQPPYAPPIPPRYAPATPYAPPSQYAPLQQYASPPQYAPAVPYAAGPEYAAETSYEPEAAYATAPEAGLEAAAAAALTSTSPSRTRSPRGRSRKPAGNRGGVVGTIVVVVVVILGGLAAWERHMRQERAREVADAAQKMADQMRGKSPGSSNSRTPAALKGLSATEAADAKMLMAEVQKAGDEAEKIGAHYQQRLAEITGDGILQPAKLDSAAETAVARQRLQKLADLVEDRQRDIDAMLARLPARIKALPLSESMKRSAIEGIQKQTTANAGVMRKLTAANREFVTEANRLVDFMDSRLNQFTVDGENISFEESADVAEYNALSARIQEAVAKEEKLMEDMAQQSEQEAEKLERLLE